MKNIKMRGIEQIPGKDNVRDKKGKLNLGFTLIELIVVMAIIGVLVLLAAPKFLGYTEKAKQTQIKNDIKVMENKLEEYLITHDGLPADWESMTIDELQQLADSKSLYEDKGLVLNTVEGDGYKVVDKTIIGDTGLDADFYANNEGKVYYQYHNQADGPVVTNESLISEVSKLKDLYSENYPSLESELAIDTAETLASNSNATSTDIQAAIDAIKVAKNNLAPMIVGADATSLGYIFNKDTLTITGYTGAIKDISIPKSFLIEGTEYEVKNIGASAFSYKALTKVTVPRNIISIGTNAFAFSSLTELVLDANLNSAGASYGPAFNGNSIGDKLTITDNVTKLPGYIFTNAGITTVRTSPYITSYGDAVYSTNKVASFIIPEYMVNIPNGFLNYNQLKSLVIPEFVKSIGTYAFANNLNLIDGLTISANLDSAGGQYGPAFGGNKVGDKLTITDNVTKLPSYIFYNAGITAVKTTPYITSYGDAVYSTNKVASFIIPEYMVNIPNGFLNYNQLKSLVIPEFVKVIGTNAFANNLNLIDGLTLSANLDSAGGQYGPAFGGNKIGDKLTITDNVTKLPSYIFYNAGITVVKTTPYITSYGDAVYSTNKVASSTIPEYMVNIPNGFLNYNQLTSLVVPETVKNIGTYAFANSSNLMAGLTIMANLDSSGGQYASAFSGNKIGNKLTIADNVTKLPVYIFYNAGLSGVINLSHFMTTIAGGAFYYNNGITAINIDNISTNVSVGANAFPVTPTFLQ